MTLWQFSLALYVLGCSEQDEQTTARGFLSPGFQAGARSVHGAGWTHGVHIAVLKELKTTAGKDNVTKLLNVFPIFTGQAGFPLASSLVYNSEDNLLQ